jgi:SAM-dependent methyltransferase
MLGVQRVSRQREAPSLPKSANLLAHLRFIWELVAVGFGWSPTRSDGSYQQRRYQTYEAYLRHQAGKLPRLRLAAYDRSYRAVLRARLQELPVRWKGMRTLCLGARTGSEVRAFLDLEAFAIGVDLNPGQGNRYVVHGDFHDLQYADGSVDVVFSNSLDHVFNLDQWISEVRRVMCPTGVLVLEVGYGLREGGRPEFYESLCWVSVSDVVADLERRGFRLLQEQEFTVPFKGRQLLLSAGSPT